MHTIAYTQSEAVLRSALKVAPKLFPKLAAHLASQERRRRIIGTPLSIGAVLLVLIAPLGMGSAQPQPNFLVLLCWAVLILGIGITIGSLVLPSNANADFLLVTETPVSFALTATAVEIESDGARNIIPWKQIRRVCVNDEFVFFVCSASAFFVPTSAFPSPEAMESFAAYASSKVLPS